MNLHFAEKVQKIKTSNLNSHLCRVHAAGDAVLVELAASRGGVAAFAGVSAGGGGVGVAAAGAEDVAAVAQVA